MSWFSKLLKGAASIASVIPGVGTVGGAAINGISGIIDGVSGEKDANAAINAQMRIAKAQIAAQQEANRKNIEFQREANEQNLAQQLTINQQNLDFNREINSLMRRDSQHAISDKRLDMARAGYSAADPSLQGFSAASLSAPSLSAATMDAPHVEPDFTPGAASAAASSLQSRSGLMSTLSQLAVDRANARAQNANAHGAEIDNNYREAFNQLRNEELQVNINNLIVTRNLTVEQANNLVAQTANIEKSTELLGEQVEQAKFTTSKQKEEFLERINNLKAQTALISSQTKLTDVQKDIAKFEKELKQLEVHYGKLGINFNSSDMLSSIARLVAAPNAKETVPIIFRYLTDTLGELAKAVVKLPIEASKAVVEGVVDGVKSNVGTLFGD